MQKIALFICLFLVGCAEPKSRSGSATFGLYCENQPVSLTCQPDCLGRWVKYDSDETTVLYFSNESDCIDNLNPLPMEQ